MEMVMVIAIIGIIMAISVPKAFDLVTNMRKKAVSERLVEDINFIRGYAMSNHDTTWLVVSQALNQYGLYSGPTAGTRVLIPDPHTGASGVLDLDIDYEGVSITSVSFGGGSELSFDWWGTPSEGGTVVMNSDRTITVIAETGMAHETP